MRIGLLVTCGLAWLLAGATCIPLVDNTTPTPNTGKTLAIAITEPLEGSTLPEGTQLRIAWTAANLTADPATISVTLESRDDLALTTLLGDHAVTGTSDTGDVTWDTEGFAGPYSLTVTITTAAETAEAKALGMLTVDPRPVFDFTAPVGNQEFLTNATTPQTLSIAWTAYDNAATARIGLDPDVNHISIATAAEETPADADVRNEIYLTEFVLAETSEPGEIEWDGTDVDGNAVALDEYYLFAIITDGVNPDTVVEGLGRITLAEEEVAEEPEEEEPEEEVVGLAITVPSEDTEFLIEDPPTETPEFRIEYQIDETNDAQVDLKVDPDDNHKNGNEITILSDDLVAGETDPDVFIWDGTDSDNNEIPDGIYRVFVSASLADTSPRTADATGLVLLRSTADQPLIGLLAPATVQTVHPGDDVAIRWRDDDPDETATIRLVLDDDNDPWADTGDQIEILSGREAKDDGVQDSDSWHVPSLTTVPARTYYIIAYIDADDDGTPEHASVAPAAVIVKDPTDT